MLLPRFLYGLIKPDTYLPLPYCYVDYPPRITARLQIVQSKALDVLDMLTTEVRRFLGAVSYDGLGPVILCVRCSQMDMWFGHRAFRWADINVLAIAVSM